MAKPRHIMIAVSDEEYQELKVAKKGLTWRELLIKGAEAQAASHLKEEAEE